MKRSTRGIPRNLKALAQSGQRVRFNGGWLGGSEVDRTVARWIDETPNAWAVMKWLVYMLSKGKLIIAEDVGTIIPSEPEAQREYSEITEALMRFDT